MCNDKPAKEIPLCEAGLRERALTVEQVEALNLHKKAADSVDTSQIYVRGFLRRTFGMPVAYDMNQPKHAPNKPIPSAIENCGEGVQWQVQIVQAIPSRGCFLSFAINRMCLGDSTVACCSSELVDSDVEVIVHLDTRSVCHIPFTESALSRVHLRREDESKQIRKKKD